MITRRNEHVGAKATRRYGQMPSDFLCDPLASCAAERRCHCAVPFQLQLWKEASRWSRCLGRATAVVAWRSGGHFQQPERNEPGIR